MDNSKEYIAMRKMQKRYGLTNTKSGLMKAIMFMMDFLLEL